MNNRYSLFNYSFLSTIFINFSITFTFYITIVITTSYSLKVLHTTENLAGLASGIFIIGALFARLYFGRIIDKADLKRYTALSLILYTLFTLIYYFVHSYSFLIFVRFIHGFMLGFASTCLGTAVSRMIPVNKRGTGIGYYALGVVFASAAAPFLAVQFININKMNYGIYLSALFLIISLFALIPVKIKKAKVNNSNETSKSKEFIEYSALPVSIIAFFMSMTYGGILSFMGDYSTKINLSQAGSWFFIVYALVTLFARPLAGRIFDAFGHNLVLIPSIIFFSAALYILANADSSIEIILSAVLTGTGYGCFFSAGQSYVLMTAPKHKAGLATATYYMLLDLGGGLGPYILGSIAGIMGYHKMYLISSFITLFTIILYIVLVYRKKHLNKP